MSGKAKYRYPPQKPEVHECKPADLQAWHPRLGFLYDDEQRYGSELRCLLCGGLHPWDPTKIRPLEPR